MEQEKSGYLKVRSEDEQKFIDKHVVNKNKDNNGNGDDVFNATNVKRSLRKPTRHGYEPGEDAKVYEEAMWKTGPRDYALSRQELISAIRRGANQPINNSTMTQALHPGTHKPVSTSGGDHINEATLSKAQMDKREEVAKAMERENPGMPMGKKMAIATSVAKKTIKEAYGAKPLASSGALKGFKLIKPEHEDEMSLAYRHKNGTTLNIRYDKSKPYKATLTDKNGKTKSFDHPDKLKSHLTSMSESVLKPLSKHDLIEITTQKYFSSSQGSAKSTVTFEEQVSSVPAEYRKALVEMYEDLSPSNRSVVLEKMRTQAGMNELIDFVIRSKGN